MDTVTFSAGLPPVPSKVVKQIQDGEYVDLADRLSQMPAQPEANKSTQPKVWPIASIMEWTQCFTSYISIRGRRKRFLIA